LEACFHSENPAGISLKTLWRQAYRDAAAAPGLFRFETAAACGGVFAPPPEAVSNL
jgi:hypothetical protein